MPKKSDHASDHFNGERFFNPWGGDSKKTFSHLLRWKLGPRPSEWPKEIVRDNVVPDRSILKSGDVRVTIINHASALIEWQGLSLLTDPTLMGGIGPLSMGLIRRYRPPGLHVESLPPPNFVLISHNHYDHLDLPSVRALLKRSSPQFVIPVGMTKDLPKVARVQSKVSELDWWESLEVPEHNLRITFVPARHWSKRTLFDTNKSLWGGFVIEMGGIEGDGIVIFFAGDTGYGPHFSEIAKKFPKIDAALLPIGAYEPRWFMKDAHMNPAEAVRAAVDLSSSLNIGIHFGTFRLTDESIGAPERALEAALAQLGPKAPTFVAAKNGQSFFAARGV